MNTRFEYMYRDGENYKQYKEVVIKGAFTLDQLRPHLYDGQFFMPSEVGLNDLQEEPYRDCDHIWHELHDAHPTPEPPNTELTAETLAQCFRTAAAAEWDTEAVRARMVELG